MLQQSTELESEFSLLDCGRPKIVSYAKVVHAAIWGETEVKWRHQAAALYRMASKRKVWLVGGTACSAINCTDRQFTCPGTKEGAR